MAHINTENKVDALILSRRASQNQNSQNTATLKEALHEFIGTAYIVQKDWGYGEIPMYKEMHKITDITVKNGVVYFLSEVMLIENDIKTGHISVSRSSQEVLPVVYEKSTELSGIFYEEIVMYYNKSLSKMFKDLNDMITDQLVIGRQKKAIKNGTVK
jgi:hypothetical protein